MKEETADQSLEILLDGIKRDKNNCEHELVLQFICILEEYNGEFPEYEKEYVKVIHFFPTLTQGLYKDLGKEAYWIWHAHEIVKGVYPIEKLPEHVRETARELYYKEKA